MTILTDPVEIEAAQNAADDKGPQDWTLWRGVEEGSGSWVWGPHRDDPPSGMRVVEHFKGPCSKARACFNTVMNLAMKTRTP